MRATYGKYIIFYISILFFGCTASNSQVISNDNRFRAVPNYETKVTYDKEGMPDAVSLKNSEDVMDLTGSPDADQFSVRRDDSEINEAEDGAIAADEENETGEENDQAMLDSALDHCTTAQELWTAGNPDKAIESLDEAYQLVLQVDTDKCPELIQQKEDLRITISKRILEIYSSRYTTANGNYKEIPLTMNGHVEKEIKLFQGAERELLLEAHKRSGRYRDEIVMALKEAGLPEELSWLPLIESWFKVRALSSARALGIWQFIPSTGYKFGLKRDTWIDERMDPGKSTAAAIAYLKELHQMFGDWTTVLAAYNCGEGNVLRVIRGQKINYLDNFWDLYERLPRETARYVPRFLAILHIIKDPEKYGFTFDQPDSPPVYESVTIEKQVQLKTVAKNLDISVDELIDLNPELRRKATPPTKYSLNIPAGMGTVLLAKLDEIPDWKPRPNEYRNYIYHTVKKGETLSHIAVKYHTNVKAIVRANKMHRRRMIRIGQKLIVPIRNGKRSDLLSHEEGLMQDNKYRAKKGDTLKLIARRFNTNTTKLKRLNRLTSSLIYEGQVLVVSK